MDNLPLGNDPSSNNTLTPGNDIKIEDTLYNSENSNGHTLKNVSSLSQNEDGTYNTQISFTPVTIKEESDIEDEGKNMSHSSIGFQSGTISSIGTASQIKVPVNNQMISSNVPLVSQGVQLAPGGGIIVNSSEGCHKVLPNHPSVVTLGQGVPFSSSLNFTGSSTMNHGPTVVTCTQNDVNQPVQMFQSSSFDNCEGMINQQSNSGQTLILTSPGAVLSSNQIVPQGQVFLQGDELVGVTLATSSASSSSTTTGYTVSNAESHYAHTLPVVLSGNQTIGNSIPRLIIQPSQAGSPNLSNQILPSNNGHYIIQVGHSAPPMTSNNFSLNNKGHIVIKAGNSKVKEEPETTPTSKDGVFRVVIPEGTTKLPRISQHIPVTGNSDDSIRKHVQINLSNRSTLPSTLPSPSKISHFDTAVQTKETKPTDKTVVNSTRKLYECSNCNSKFMKPLYLRMHMRSCKKPEVKLEKSPLFMCSFCKATFKTKPTIYSHFTKCSQNPYQTKEDSGKRKLEDDGASTMNKKIKLEVCELDSSLEMAVLFKCQDCDRTFSKERQYTSHIKRCTKISVHDMSGAKLEHSLTVNQEEEHETSEDPFADPPLPPPPARRGRGGGGRRGRPPGKVSTSAQKGFPKNNVLFEGEKVQPSVGSLVVADNENLVRSTTGLAHTIQLSLERANAEGRSQPMVLVADSKGVKSMEKPPHAWSLVCSLCQKMFLTKAALANHMIENHGNDLRNTRSILIGQSNDGSLYKCPFCHLHYQNSSSVIEHFVIQHTSELQEQYKTLQGQTGSFVCSLCSLVLLTKNLLMEHLSLEHLDQLEKTHLTTQASRRRKNNEIQNLSTASTNGELQDIKTEEGAEETENFDEGKYSLIEKEDGEEIDLECGFCGEEFPSTNDLVSHYSQAHNVQMYSDGTVLDMGVDVDIRVKNTKRLIQLADGKVSDGSSLPEKTVLIRKKPKQSWQCQSCHQVFSKQMTWLRHIRETCPGTNQSSVETMKTTASRESHFFCQEPECSHLAFYQVKSLFKHMEEVHKTTIPKERRTFQSLLAFNQWLTEEENSKSVRFLRDSTRVEKSNVRLIQMVCHRFHTAKMAQSKEKELFDIIKPGKKRWASRIQRANNCHARIHLRVEFNSFTKDYDGETQMIYYPKHFHSGEEDTPEVLDQIREKYPRDKSQGHIIIKTSVTTSSSCFAEGDSGSSFSLDSTSDILQLQTDDSNCDDQQNNKQTLQTDVQNDIIVSSAPLQVTSVVVPNPANPTVIIPQTLPANRSTVIFGGGEQSASKSLIMDSGDEAPFIVMNSDEHRNSEETQDYTEEYVLPVDDAEWNKLFDALSTRLSSGELSSEETKEGTVLLSYKNLIAVISVAEQVSIFQRMCALTNTSLESV